MSDERKKLPISKPSDYDQSKEERELRAKREENKRRMEASRNKTPAERAAERDADRKARAEGRDFDRQIRRDEADEKRNAAAKARDDKLHRRNQPENHDRTGMVDLGPLRPLTNKLQPTVTHDRKAFSFALSPAKAGNSTMYYGRFFSHVTKFRFNHMNLNGVEFNSLSQQDSETEVKEFSPDSLRKDFGLLRETNLPWRGSFYLYWETDMEGTVTSVDIVGPDKPDAVEIPLMDSSLSRNWNGETGGKYCVLIGSVSDSGDVSQRISSDFHWYHTMAMKDGDTWIGYLGYNLDLIVKRFEVVTGSPQSVSGKIQFPSGVYTSTDGSHTHTVTATGTIDASGFSISSSGAHYHSLTQHAHETTYEPAYPGFVGYGTGDSLWEASGSGSAPKSGTPEFSRTGLYSSGWTDDGSHTHTFSGSITFSGNSVTTSSSGSHSHTLPTSEIDVTLTIPGSPTIQVVTSDWHILCWRNGVFVGKFSNSDLTKPALPAENSYTHTIYVWDAP